jgi:hypothetical protein
LFFLSVALLFGSIQKLGERLIAEPDIDGYMLEVRCKHLEYAMLNSLPVMVAEAMLECGYKKSQEVDSDFVAAVCERLRFSKVYAEDVDDWVFITKTKNWEKNVKDSTSSSNLPSTLFSVSGYSLSFFSVLLLVIQFYHDRRNTRNPGYHKPKKD